MHIKLAKENNVKMIATIHQYIDRETGIAMDENLFADRCVNLIYSLMRERASFFFRMITSSWYSDLIAKLNYDFPFAGKKQALNMAEKLGVNVSECLEPDKIFSSARNLFERKIRYWETRPMPGDSSIVVSPADSRAIIGSIEESGMLFIKEKFFSLPDLLMKKEWISKFESGDFAVFRLTPDKYHYSHSPVSGVVVDHYEIDGVYHSCNPSAVVAEVSPYSKNRRIVTIIDTDIDGGTWVGLVAMIEVVALMIGGISQCYSREKYDFPSGVEKGMFLEKGSPKSLFHPGSSTDVLVFEKGRVAFSEDLVMNRFRSGIKSRFSLGFGQPLVETDVRVRSEIARGA